MRRVLAITPFLLLLAACNSPVGDGTVDVAYIGEARALFDQGPRGGPSAQLMRAARWQGLVRFDAAGQVVPALAERWIVTDDGLSYIFRLGEYDVAESERLDAPHIRRELERAMGDLEGTSFGLDLAKVSQIRAMTGRVIEIRLVSPMPGFLQLLAQPELALPLDNGGARLMALSKKTADTAVFTPLPPEARGLPQQAGWTERIRPISITNASTRDAVRGFAIDRYDVILGGAVQDLPLASSGPLSGGTVRLDAAIGLFGLDVSKAEGFLETALNREALAMALARGELVEPLGIDGWSATARIVPANLPGAQGLAQGRWPGLSLDQRRRIATQRINRWKAENGAEVRLSLYLPEGPGSRILFDLLRAQYALIGIVLDRTERKASADLVLRDRVARFAGPRWFLNQFHCDISPKQCLLEADGYVAQAVATSNPALEARYLAEAETVLTAQNLYIPLGAPIRWSQVRSDVPGFAENPWAFHPLFPMSDAPI